MPQLAREIFKDYKEENNILESVVDNVNLFKKSNILEINLSSENKITIRDLFSFEMYLKKRFNLNGIKINIKYTEEIKFDLEDEWEDIVKYIVYKYPSTKALLSDNKIEIQDKNITIYLAAKGKEILIARGIDKVVERIVEVLYNKKYKVSFNDENKNEEEQIKYLKHLEEQAIENAKKEIIEHKKEIVVEPLLVEETETQEQEKSPLILGRNGIIKEEIVQVKDITADLGKISLQGEVISTDSRELKTGKVLVMFNVYDGTSTITCKAFVEADKAKKILDRMIELRPKDTTAIKTRMKIAIEDGDIRLANKLERKLSGIKISKDEKDNSDIELSFLSSEDQEMEYTFNPITQARRLIYGTENSIELIEEIKMLMEEQETISQELIMSELYFNSNLPKLAEELLKKCKNQLEKNPENMDEVKLVKQAIELVKNEKTKKFNWDEIWKRKEILEKQENEERDS